MPLPLVPSSAPWEVPPPGAINFNGQERTTITGAAGADVTAILAQLNTPEHLVGVVRELSFQINDVTVSSDVVFTFRINQGGVEGFQFDIFPKSASTDIVEYDPPTTMVPISKGSLMDVLVRVRAGDIATYLVGAFYRGWWYAEDLDQAWRERGRQ